MNQIVTLPSLNPNFPSQPDPEVPRDNILDTIETMFAGGTSIVVVEGEEGFGKTTLLSQFARRHPQTTISSFIVSGNRWAYDPKLIRLDIAHQLHWLVKREELRSADLITDEQLTTYYRRLSSQWRFRDTNITFVLDGLHNIPSDEYGTLRIILSLVPLGRGEFRFLISGNSETLRNEANLRTAAKPYPLAPFNPDETKHFFSDRDLPEDVVLDLHRTFRGIPGHLATVKRTLDSGLSAKQILVSPEREIVGLFDVEWQQVGEFDDELRLALAAVAFLSPAWTEHDLADLLEMDKDRLSSQLSELTFLNVDDSSRRLKFVSEAYRRYAQNQLEGFEEKVRERAIDQLLKRDDAEQSFKYLPDLYLESGRYEDLLQYLDPDTLTRMVPLVGSAGPLRDKTELGLRGARELGRDGELFRFCIERSLISELAGVDVWDTEIEARMALGKEASARALADRVQLQEDRLHLLAIIARVSKQRGLQPDPSLIEEIEHLYGEIDAVAISNRATEVAAELVHSCPELALDLVEKTADLADSENALDAALAALSVSALQDADDGLDDRQNLTEQIRSRIGNPGLRHLADGASLLFGDSTTDDVINLAEEFNDADEALFLIRQWLSINSGREDAAKLIGYGLDRTIKASNYSPSARVYRELADALPSVQDRDRKKSLVLKFDGQKQSARSVGPTLEFVRLQCLIAQSQSSYDLDAAVYRIVDLYYDTEDFQDLSQRLAAQGIFKVTLAKLDSNGQLLAKELGLTEELEQDFEQTLDEVLEGSAHQYEALKQAVSVMAPEDLELATQVAERLNTQSRRDRCRLLTCRKALESDPDQINLGEVITLLLSIRSHPLQDKGLSVVLRRVYYSRDFEPDQVDQLRPLIDRTESIHEADRRARAYCYWLGLVARYEDWNTGLGDHFQDRLFRSWEEIDARWSKVELGFEIAALVAEHHSDLAEEYFERSLALRAQASLNASAHGSAYLLLLDLVGRAHRGLVSANIHRDGDLQRLERLMDSIPGAGVRAAMWGDVALRTHLGGDPVDSQEIVTRHVRPLLEDIESRNRGLYLQVLTDVAPALYTAHRTTALRDLEELPPEYRDVALLRIADFISYKCLPGEPHKNYSDAQPDLDAEETVDLLDLAGRLSVDGNAAIILWRVAKATREKHRLTQRQRGDFSKRIREIAADKFPDPDNIQHEGYLVTALACANSVERGSPESWSDLRRQAEKIPNAADRVFVLGFIASIMRPAGGERRTIFKAARDAVREVPTLYDRVSRLLDLANWAMSFDKKEAKECVEEAMRGSAEVEYDEVQDIHQRAIDLAHQIDPDFASGLTEFVDPDRVSAGSDLDTRRVKIQAHLTKQVRIREVRQEIVEDRNALVSAKREDLAGSGRETLASINAGRFVLFDKEVIHSIVADLSSYDLRDVSYWYACLIEVLHRKYDHTDQAPQILRPVFEHLCFTAEFCQALVARNNDAATTTLPVTEEETGGGVLIREGEREKALALIQEWLKDAVHESIVICDPYFGPESLEALQLIQSEAPGSRVRILTSRRHHDQEVEAPWDLAYERAWRKLSDVKDPPNTEVVVVGSKTSGKAPIHDRWWLSLESGLKMGTSFRSIGRSGDCDISRMDAGEAQQKLAEVIRYLDAKKRLYSGERLSYTTLLLP